MKLQAPIEMNFNQDAVPFFLEAFDTNTAPDRYIRELYRNAEQAIEEVQKVEEYTGHIIFTTDPAYAKRSIKKLCVIDSGAGFADLSTLKTVLKSGRTQSVDGNFGLGARATTLQANPQGVLYVTFRDSKHQAAILKQTSYIPVELSQTELTLYTNMLTRIAGSAVHGTFVTLLGKTPTDDTTAQPINLGGSKDRWLPRVLDKVIYRRPKNICVKLTSTASTWGNGEQFGHFSFFEKTAAESGRAAFADFDVEWFILKNDPKTEANVSKTLRTRHVGTDSKHLHGSFALVFENEMHDFVSGDRAFSPLGKFGIRAGFDKISLMVFPKKGVTIDLSRTRMQKDQAPLPLTVWGREFANAMPTALEAYMKSREAKDYALNPEKILEELSHFATLFSDLKTGVRSNTQVPLWNPDPITVTDPDDRPETDGVTPDSPPAPRQSKRPKVMVPNTTWVNTQNAPDLADNIGQYNAASQSLRLNEGSYVLKQVRKFALIEAIVREEHSRYEERAEAVSKQVVAKFAIKAVNSTASLCYRRNLGPDVLDALLGAESLNAGAEMALTNLAEQAIKQLRKDLPPAHRNNHSLFNGQRMAATA